MSGFGDFTREIKTLPSCLRRSGRLINKDGELSRAPNGIYAFIKHAAKSGEARHTFFASEQQIIDFINKNLPWRGENFNW